MRKIFLALLLIATMSIAASAQNINGQAEKTETKAVDFSNLSASWTTWFSNFDNGFYGLKYEGFANNMVYTIAFRGNWGVSNPGMYNWRIGIGPSRTLNDWFAIVAPISFQMGDDYIKEATMDKNGNIKFKTDLSYSLIVSPGARFKLGGAVFGVSFDLGGCYADKIRFYKAFELSLGFTI